ncbi:baseplate assembly protein [Desulfoluna butyratoxydans]|uniref:Baseplate protein j-like n=1 Tax=Desulfoluna butyratoxydans TaxID=231438 RepID=A0A4U8YSZ3_9BACT|nr:baseplate J/gp47 family protein [Desulfoluna butyratoxydans]VFQ46924.1 baseplate protein j-like [Desulfoluna butyratoxydans]
MSLKNLPDIQFVEADAEKTISNILTVHEGITGKSLSPADPERLFLMGLASIIVQQRELINHAGKMNLLAYSEGDHLDHLGAFTETERLDSSAAGTLCRFSIAEPLGFVVAINKGIRVSPDGTLFFKTESYAEVAAGESFVDVPVTCMATGAVGNGYVPGQINQMVDPVPYVVSVSNTITSTGGADREGNEPYRERIHNAPDKYSVAGPEGAYIYWAKSAHQEIADVAVVSPADATVQVVVLLSGGRLPDETILQTVADAVTPKNRRPLTDRVSVIAPVPVGFDIDADYFISGENQEAISEIQSRVSKAIADYTAWQSEKLGRDINPDELVFRLKSAGAKRVVLRSPSFQKLATTQVAQAGTQTLNYAGVEDE